MNSSDLDSEDSFLLDMSSCNLVQLAMVEAKFTRYQADTKKSDRRTNEILVRRKISEKARDIYRQAPIIIANLRKVPTFDVSLSNKG